MFKTLIILFLFPHTIFAQNWNNLNPFGQPPSNGLFAVDFTDSLYGWAVGEWGIILHTQDGGETWQVQQNSTVNKHLTSVDFLNREVGYAVGYFGVIYYTHDGGITWVQNDYPTFRVLQDVVALNDTLAIIVGDGSLVLKTDDGGINWNEGNIGVEGDYYNITFIDSINGWISGGNGLLAKTNNAGEDWTEVNVPTTSPIFDVDFLNQTNGWLLSAYNSNSGVLKTRNGGDHWDIVKTFGGQTDISLIDTSKSWIIGNDNIYFTANGGEQWTKQTYNSEEVLNDIQDISPTTALVVGDKGVIYKTTDQGGNWVIKQMGEYYNLSVGQFVNKHEGWFADGYTAEGIWKSENGGISWFKQFDYTTFSKWDTKDILFIDNNTGLILSDRLWRTFDGGVKWEGIRSDEVASIATLEFHNGLLFGAGTYEIFKSSNWGDTWTKTNLDGFPIILDIFFADSLTGYATGEDWLATDNGLMLKTIDGGNSWIVLTDIFLIGYKCFFNSSNYGFTVGFSPFVGGLVAKTKDGGTTWVDTVLTTSNLNDIFMINDSTGWIVGDYGNVFFTDDSGRTWQNIDVRTYANLKRIWFVENNTVGYIFGEDNTLLKIEYIPNVLNEQGNFNPGTLLLKQNYPNPFNNSTTIEIIIIESSFVTIDIFTSTGKKIKTLNKGKVNPGKKTVIWDGTDNASKQVSSGIYYCRLTTKNMQKVIKLLYLR